MNARQRKKWLKRAGVTEWFEHVAGLIAAEAGFPSGAFHLALKPSKVRELSRKRR